VENRAKGIVKMTESKGLAQKWGWELTKLIQRQKRGEKKKQRERESEIKERELKKELSRQVVEMSRLVQCPRVAQASQLGSRVHPTKHHSHQACAGAGPAFRARVQDF